MCNILSIISFVIAGFFVYTCCFFGFINMGVTKYVMMVAFFISILVFLLFGIKLNKSRAWKKSVGLVLMWGAIPAGFLMLTFVCMLASPDILKMFPADSVAVFSFIDYIAGTIITILFLIVGYGLQRLGNQSPAEQIVPENVVQ